MSLICSCFSSSNVGFHYHTCENRYPDCPHLSPRSDCAPRWRCCTIFYENFYFYRCPCKALCYIKRTFGLLCVAIADTRHPHCFRAFVSEGIDLENENFVTTQATVVYQLHQSAVQLQRSITMKSNCWSLELMR